MTPASQRPEPASTSNPTSLPIATRQPLLEGGVDVVFGGGFGDDEKLVAWLQPELRVGDSGVAVADVGELRREPPPQGAAPAGAAAR